MHVCLSKKIISTNPPPCSTKLTINTPYAIPPTMPFNNNNNNKEKNATREPAGTAIELNALDYVLFFSLFSLSLSRFLFLSSPPPLFPGHVCHRVLPYLIVSSKCGARVCNPRHLVLVCSNLGARQKKKKKRDMQVKKKKGQRKPPVPILPPYSIVFQPSQAQNRHCSASRSVVLLDDRIIF